MPCKYEGMRHIPISWSDIQGWSGHNLHVHVRSVASLHFGMSIAYILLLSCCGSFASSGMTTLLRTRSSPTKNCAPLARTERPSTLLQVRFQNFVDPSVLQYAYSAAFSPRNGRFSYATECTARRHHRLEGSNHFATSTLIFKPGEQLIYIPIIRFGGVVYSS